MRSVDMVIDDVEYNISEVMLNDMYPFMQNDENVALTPIKLLDFCVTVDGEKYDREKHNLPLRHFNKLVAQVSIINGFAEEEGEEKKD